MWFKTLVKSNLYFLVPFVAFLCLGGFFLAMYDKETLFFAINSRYSTLGDFCFKYYTHVGDGIFYLFMAFLVLLFGSKYKAILMVASYAFTSLLAQSISGSILIEYILWMDWILWFRIAFRVVIPLLHSRCFCCSLFL